MPLEDYECRQCDKTFRAEEDSNAAQNSYCSRRCESTGEGLS